MFLVNHFRKWGYSWVQCEMRRIVDTRTRVRYAGEQ